MALHIIGLGNKIIKVLGSLPSDITSLNHKDILNTTLRSPIIITSTALVKPWKVNTALNVRTSKEKLVLKGQGEGDTKWKGCGWNKLLVIIVIILFIN